MGFSNLQKVLGQLRRYGQDFHDGAAAGQVDAAERILERAKVYCPKDTEALVRSGRVVIELRELRRASAQIRFGDGATEAYAVVQHERLDYKHDPPEQAKYLQRAVDELSPQMSVLIGRGAVTAAKRRLR